MNSLYEIVKKRVQEKAEIDFKAGLPCESSRYGALPGSAWDEWYSVRYQELKIENIKTNSNEE